MIEADIAWTAGLFEGEGHIGYARSRGRQYVRLTLSSTDEDVIKRFQGIVGGCVYGPRTRADRPQNKPYWIWQVASRSAVAELIDLWSPYLGERRAGAAYSLIQAVDEHERRQKTRSKA